MIALISSTILEYLTQNKAFKGFQIEEFPDKFEQYAFTSAKGCLLVRDDGSSFSKTEEINKIVQFETIRVAVVIGLRYTSYKDTKIQYDFVEQVKNELTGLRIRDKRLYPTSRDFVGSVKDDFWHEVGFEITLKSESGIHNTPPEFEATSILPGEEL